MAKKILVTGGSGFIGTALVKRLLEKGNFVRVLDNNSRGKSENLSILQEKFPSTLECRIGDIRDFHVVQKSCQEMESVCHLAYVNGTEFFYSKPELVLEVGVKGMIHVLDGCIQENVPELILMSSSEVYQTPPSVPTEETVPLSVPDPLNPRYSYGGGKIISELLAIHYGGKYLDRVLIARPHNVYGPNMGMEHVIPQFVHRLWQLSLEGQKSPLDFSIQGTGKETRAFVFVEDFVDGFMKMMEKGEHLSIYHIGTDQEISILNLAKQVVSTMNLEVHISPGELQKGGTLRRCPDISKLRKLGYSPKISLEEGLQKTVNWYINFLNKKNK